MRLTFRCPGCHEYVQADLPESALQVQCPHCAWSRAIPAASTPSGTPSACLVCGCRDLWRQKDFPQKLGLALVVLGAVLSTIAWAKYMPITALGILMAFALGDLLLYTWMRDVLVCYRCSARHGRMNLAEETRYFNLEVAERYRQEAQRLKQ